MHDHPTPATGVHTNLLMGLLAVRLFAQLSGNDVLSRFALYLAGWTVLVTVCRSALRSARKAAAAVSLSYCAAAVAWSCVTLAAETWPSNGFDFKLRELPLGPGCGIHSFLLFSAAYFASDLYFDYDTRFVAHHLLSLAAMVTTWAAPNLEGSFTVSIAVAELGGVAYHVSKLVRQDWMTRTYLVVYAASRLALYPALLVWLAASLGPATEPLFFVNLWALSGTTVLVLINVQWCYRSFVRYAAEVRSRGGGGARAPRPLLAKASPPPTPQGSTKRFM